MRDELGEYLHVHIRELVDLETGLADLVLAEGFQQGCNLFESALEVETQAGFGACWRGIQPFVAVPSGRGTVVEQGLFRRH